MARSRAWARVRRAGPDNALLPGQAHWRMRLGGFGDLVADAHHGIEGGHRLLKDHGHAAAAQGLQFAGRAEARLRPSNSTPPESLACGGRRPMMARAVTLLPEPDSPTRASVSPGATESEISRTAATGPRAEGNSTVRFCSSRSTRGIGTQMGRVAFQFPTFAKRGSPAETCRQRQITFSWPQRFYGTPPID